MYVIAKLLLASGRHSR